MDEQYLKHAITLEEGQLEQLITSYWSDIWNYVYVMTRNRSVSDDLTQETFIRAFNSLSSFRMDSSYHTWLVRIARNLTLNYKRSAFFRRIVLRENVSTSRSNVSAETVFMQHQRVSEMWERVFRLPAKQREVLILEAKHEISVKDIAELLKIPEGTVKSRLNRARRQMNEWLKEELKDERN